MITSIILVSCAGPTSPFGALNFTQKKTTEVTFNADEKTSVSFYPAFKLYHKPYELWIEIKDDNIQELKNLDYEIIYNNEVIDRPWSTEEIIRYPNDPKKLSLRFKDFRLNPLKNNHIVFRYRRASDAKIFEEELLAPECPYFQDRTIASLAPFKKNHNYQAYIKNTSLKFNKNASLLAGLVAQESSFNYNSLSFARALGLTQITPLASKQIEDSTLNWPSYPKLNELSYYEIKALIFLGKLNQKNDWRLNPKLSLEGGAIYLTYLEKYWQKEDNKQILETIFKENIPWSDVILASYNSGAYRVKKSIVKKGKRWLDDRPLLEAKKYVKNIKSYCTAFHKSY